MYAIRSYYDPLDIVDFIKGFLPQPQVVHGDKPLGGGPVNDGLFTAPAVGIGMGHVFLLEQRPFFFQGFIDFSVGLKNKLAFKQPNPPGKCTVVLHRRIAVQAIAIAGNMVVGAVARGSMNAAGSGLKGDVSYNFV